MALDIKICGLKTLETLDAALDYGANHVGFVFFSKSPRNISIPLAVSLRDNIDERARIVAVTVNADNKLLDDIVYQVKPDLLQLHGSETPKRVVEVKQRYKLPIMKAISIHSRLDLQKIAPYCSIVDRFLFDSRAPNDVVLPGGNGISFDWRVLDGLNKQTHYMLSGGLRAENVTEALTITNARGIDVSSGVERAPGVKDIHLIKAFLEASLKIHNAIDRIGVYRESTN